LLDAAATPSNIKHCQPDIIHIRIQNNFTALSSVHHDQFLKATEGHDNKLGCLDCHVAANCQWLSFSLHVYYYTSGMIVR
jgi:hypothetical protein